MKLTKPRIVLGVALAATLVATWLAPDPQTGEEVLALPATATAGPSPSRLGGSNVVDDRTVQGEPEVFTIRARHDDGKAVRIFSQAIKPPVAPPRPLVPELPPVPVAPPLPFRVMGRYLDSGVEAAFLQHNDVNLVVRAGDTIANQYKVESLSGSTLTLRHLPTDQLQSLYLGSWN